MKDVIKNQAIIRIEGKNFLTKFEPIIKIEFEEEFLFIDGFVKNDQAILFELPVIKKEQPKVVLLKISISYNKK